MYAEGLQTANGETFKWSINDQFILQYLDLFRRNFLTSKHAPKHKALQIQNSKIQYNKSRDLATNTKEKRHSGEANNSSASQEICILWSPKFHYRAHKSPRHS